MLPLSIIIIIIMSSSSSCHHHHHYYYYYYYYHYYQYCCFCCCCCFICTVTFDLLDLSLFGNQFRSILWFCPPVPIHKGQHKRPNNWYFITADQRLLNKESTMVRYFLVRRYTRTQPMLCPVGNFLPFFR